MEVMVAVQSGTLLHALRVQLKRRVSARRGGDYNEVPQAIQKKSRPSPSNFFPSFSFYTILEEPVIQQSTTFIDRSVSPATGGYYAYVRRLNKGQMRYL